MISLDQRFGELHISYYNDAGNVVLEKIKIPESEMYNWQECTASDKDKDPIFLNQYRNHVKKIPTKYLNKYRLKEYFLGRKDLHDRIFKKTKPKKWFMDIETTSIHGFPDHKNPIESLLCYALCDDTNKVHVMGIDNLTNPEKERLFRMVQDYFDDQSNYLPGFQKCDIKFEFKYHYYTNESQLLQHFYYKLFPQLPMLLGWNFIGFDLPYMNSRAKSIGIDISKSSPTGQLSSVYIRDKYDEEKNMNLEVPMHKCVLDYMRIYEKWDTSQKFKTSMALDNVASNTVGVRKLQYSGTIQQFYENDPVAFMAYCCIDTILVRLIDDKLNTLKSAMQLARRSMVPFIENEYASTMLESCFIKESLDKNMVTTKPKVVMDETYPGAYVEQPKPGFFKSVSITDFASQYPSIMMYGNIGIDTLLGTVNPDRKTYVCWKTNNTFDITENSIITHSGSVYDKSSVGITRSILGSFFHDRKEYKRMGSVAQYEMNLIKKHIEGSINLSDRNESTELIDFAYLESNSYSTESLNIEYERINHIKIEAKNDDSSTKILLNSVYGVIGYSKFPWYKRDVAYTVTKESQELIKFSIRMYNHYFKNVWHTSELDEFRNKHGISRCNKIDIDVVNYADTDSIFIVLDSVIENTDYKGSMDTFCTSLYDEHLEKWLKNRFEEHLNSMNAINNKPNGDFAIIMELEQVCHSILWTGKKRYIKEIAYVDKTKFERLKNLQVKGMEMNKSSTSKFVREKLMNITNYILSKNAQIDAKDLIKEVTKIRSEFYTTMPENIGTTERTGNYNKYIKSHDLEVVCNPNCKLHIRGSAYFNHMVINNKLQDRIRIIGSGQKVTYYYVDQQKHPGMDVFSFPVGEFPDFAPPIDRIKQFETIFLGPLNSILVSINMQPLKPSLINIPTMSW